MKITLIVGLGVLLGLLLWLTVFSPTTITNELADDVSVTSPPEATITTPVTRHNNVVPSEISVPIQSSPTVPTPSLVIDDKTATIATAAIVEQHQLSTKVKALDQDLQNTELQTELQEALRNAKAYRQHILHQAQQKSTTQQ